VGGAHGLEFLGRGGHGGLDRCDFSQPALLFGLLQAVDEVGVDLPQSRRLGRVNPKEWTPDAPLTELTAVFEQVGALHWGCVDSLPA
jgi:hypothetical protein